MTIIQKAADIAQRGSVLGLMSLLGFQIYQITKNANEGLRDQQNNDNQQIMKQINEKVKEEEARKGSIDTIADRYDRDDDSYLKNVPKLNVKSSK
eukprot:CAMPEP_0119555142 /NCGR_PEP_ID=MMETSP1352-20130426/7447_1 /TAXON_ID=265584 /ORGANISM="Stauroneis constricta, Strain CCMP1120" /LENGTH=94 /DNA_ID=CAMNT_0007601857 /DNA_START=66 /DNA_END=350 /DNA_ORIENTATION=-